MRRNATIRCAIYTRKSSEEGLEQEFNSLQAQREACEAIHTIRDLFGPEWLRRRGDAMAIAAWLGRSQQQARPKEAEAARVLAELIRTERLQ